MIRNGKFFNRAVIIISLAAFWIPALLGGSHDNQISSTSNSSQNATASYSILNVPARVWVASLVSITLISVVGLAGVAVVPIITKTFYNHVIHFLVALAVGSLTGDAMLHLLPHAIVASVLEETGTEKHKHDETRTIYKGLAALGGAYFFFMAEKILAIVSDYRSEKKAKQEDATNPKSPNSALLDAPDGDKKKSNTGYMRKESAVSKNYAKNMDSGEEMLMFGLNSVAMKALDNKLKNNDPNDCTIEGDHEGRVKISIEHASDENVENNHAHEEMPQSHGHGHGHSHEVPDSIAAVAWMVIMGDGLHNFSDGLAIGAAFAQSVSGGLSTAVAVFCHELPHELGDFAVLLKTGMKVKQALFYNMVSSILCFIGMLIGIALGNVNSVSYWIFAVAGGMFIYIALVDMLPELSSANIKPGESRLLHLFIQNLGLLMGVSIMLVIALYEENIKLKLDFEV